MVIALYLCWREGRGDGGEGEEGGGGRERRRRRRGGRRKGERRKEERRGLKEKEDPEYGEEGRERRLKEDNHKST